MKKLISIIISLFFILSVIPASLFVSHAASTCPKGHTYSEHYCKTCKTFESGFTGMAKKDSTWYYVKNGKIDTTFTGLAKNSYGWWYMTDGKIDYKYVGMAKNQYGWWYVQNGTINFKYTGMAKNQYGWWYMKNGKLDTTYTGMAKNQYGWWYMRNGKLDTTFTGMAKNQYGWWYMKNGKLDTTFTGISGNEYAYWYMKNGKLDKSYNGTYTDKNGAKWNVKDGRATKKSPATTVTTTKVTPTTKTTTTTTTTTKATTTTKPATTTTSSNSGGLYRVDPVACGFPNPIGTIKAAWILKDPNGKSLSSLGLDIRVSRVELNKTVTQTFDSKVSSQIVNPKTITYKPCCSVAVINCLDHDPTHIKITKNTANKASMTQDIAQSVNAIMAIDNQVVGAGKEFYATEQSAVIRNGEIFKKYTGNGKDKVTRLIMYRDGTWKYGTLDNEEAKKAVADGAYNSIYYFDVAVRDSKVTAYIPPNTVYRNRTYLGQINKDKYVMMVTEYMPLDDAAKVLIAYGCKDAVMITGGNCTQMYVNNVGNTTGRMGASVKNLNKIGYLETEWMASKGLLAPNAGGGPCGHEIDVVYLK